MFHAAASRDKGASAEKGKAEKEKGEEDKGEGPWRVPAPSTGAKFVTYLLIF